MATKVGAFKKDGTVQCVKLVEEAGDSLLSQFNGTLTNNILTLNNGMKLEFLLNDAPASFANLATTGIQLCYYDTSSPYITLRSSNNKDFTATYTGSSTGISWESENPMYITGVFWYVPGYGNIEVNITLNGVTYGFSRTTIIEQSNLSLLIPRSGDAIEIPLSMRVKPATVRMGKDGTLRCSKLIEESAQNLEGWNGAVMAGGVVTLDNGFKLSMVSGTTGATMNPLNSYITGFVIYVTVSSTASGPFISLHRSQPDNQITATKVATDANYEKQEDLYIRQVVVNATTRYMDYSTLKVRVESPDGSSFDYSYITSQQIGTNDYVIIYNATSTPDTLVVSVPYDTRMNKVSVRVGKDGTLRCAKVQEATPTSKIGIGEEWFDLTRASASSGVFSLHNGSWTITVQGPNGGAPTLFQTVSTISAQTLSRDGTPVTVIQWVGPPPYTTYYPSLYDTAAYNDDGDVGINRLNVVSTSSLSGYTILVNNGRSIITYQHSFFTGTNNVFIPSGDQPWVLTYSDRFTYSWD